MAAFDTPRWTCGEAIPRNQIPLVEIADFRDTVIELVRGGRVVAFFGQPAERDLVRLLAVIAFADSNTLSMVSTTVGDSYPARRRPARRCIGTSARSPSNGASRRWGIPG